MSTNSTTGTAARSQRLGGSTVTRIASGEYVYAWGLRSYRIISVAAASCGESNEQAWHVYRQAKDGSIGCYLDTFATKRDAIAVLEHVLDVHGVVLS